MTPTNPASSSPKRKRSLPPTTEKISPSRLNISTSSPIVSEEEGVSGSPRTNVAHRFQALELDGGSVIRKLDLKGSSREDGGVEEGHTVKKRIKFSLEDGDMEIPETPETFATGSNPDRYGDAATQKFTGDLQMHDSVGPVVFKGLSAHSSNRLSALSRSYPSINRLSDSKSRSRKRTGTPPLVGGTDATAIDIEDTIVDPDRAALTWHDDEITGHDPSDPEDDGEGINGIGFKPTPAEARARMEKRRQQMAEYKSREMKEARAKRSERRRGGLNVTTSSRDETARRVRFSEAEANVIITAS